MNVLNYKILIVSAFILCSCSNPYSSLYDESSSNIAEDSRFVESYKDTICGIKDQHENKEITRGKCLALYYEHKDQSHIKEEKEKVVKRVGYILENPDKFDKKTHDKLSIASMEIANCDNYIMLNCM